MIKKILLLILLCISTDTYANSLSKDFTILFTGETHGMIYPCKCAVEPDGGVSRRRTIIENKRKQGTVFLLDAGGFFAGTQYDIYTEGEPKDKLRTIANINAMEIMGYDAVALGDDEFIFGLNFVKENLLNKLPTISCNLNYSDNNIITSSYKIIQKDNIKLGVIAITSPDVLNINEELKKQIKIDDPFETVEKIIKNIKTEVDYLVVISHLGEESSLAMAEKLKDIDLLINSHKKTSIGNFTFINNTLVAQFNYQGKRITEINVSNKTSTFNEIRVSEEIEEDKKIKDILNQFELDSKMLETKVKLDLFVMSYCPFGISAEKEIYDLLQNLKNLIDFNLHFIVDKENDTYTSLHGKNELDENKRQLFIQKNYPDIFWDYLQALNNSLNKNFKDCLENLNIDTTNINQNDLLEKDYTLTKRLRINASPTLFINNKQYKGKIEKSFLIREICKTLPENSSTKINICIDQPECLDDSDCTKPGMFGKCEQNSKCIYTKDVDISMKFLYSTTMIFPDYYKTFDYLNSLFPDIKASSISIESDEGKEIIKKYNIKYTPAFIFSESIEKAKNFQNISSKLIKQDNEYLLNTIDFKNTIFLIDEPKIDNRIEVLISPVFPQSYLVIDAIDKITKVNNKNKINVKINYIINKNEKNVFYTTHGQQEVEEIQRQIAIKKYYPEKFNLYLQERKQNLHSSYWEDPIINADLDPQKIKKISQSDEIKSIIINDIERIKKFQINSDVAVIINNQERILLNNNKQFQEFMEKLSIYISK